MTNLLTNFDLQHLCAQFDIPLHFVGFKEDLNHLPKLENGAYIINLDRTRSKGTHWVCFCKHGSTIMYYDSFGENAPVEVLHTCRKYKCSLIESHFHIQDLQDDSCGFYCLAFLHYMKDKQLTNRDLNLYNDQFNTDDTRANRKILEKIIQSIAKKYSSFN
jgi:hypothetical protein